MGILTVLLYVVEVAVCLLLVGIILLQRGSKDGGGAAGLSMGGGMGEAVFGGQVGNVLTKGTIVLGVIFLVNTLTLAILSAGKSGSIMEGSSTRTQAAAPVEMPAAMPIEDAAPVAMPAAPAAPVAPAPVAAPAAPVAAPVE